jgi:hypothetical protein
MKTKRMIRVWHPNNPQGEFEFTGDTTGELFDFLHERGYQTEGYKATEGRTFTALENKKQILPAKFSYRGVITSDLVVIFTPKTTIKSGAYTYREAIARIKSIRDRIGKQKALELFGNYTHLSTDALNGVLADYEFFHDTEGDEIVPSIPDREEGTCTCTCDDSEGSDDESEPSSVVMDREDLDLLNAGVPFSNKDRDRINDYRTMSRDYALQESIELNSGRGFKEEDEQLINELTR